MPSHALNMVRACWTGREGGVRTARRQGARQLRDGTATARRGTNISEARCGGVVRDRSPADTSFCCVLVLLGIRMFADIRMLYASTGSTCLVWDLHVYTLSFCFDLLV